MRRNRAPRILENVSGPLRRWAPLAVVAAVPVAVIAAPGSTPGIDGRTAGAVDVRAAASSQESTGIGPSIARLICPIVGTNGCHGSASTSVDTTGTDTGSETDTSTGTETGTAGDTSTGSSATSTGSKSPGGVCDNVRVPGLCGPSTTSSESTVSVSPPSSDTSTKTKTKTKTTRTKSSTKTKNQSTRTVTVTVTETSTRSTTASSTTTTGT